MNEIPESIKQGKGVPTDEERAVLDAYAESTGEPEKIWQVYDETNITDEEYLGTEKAGPPHATEEAAVEWANRQPGIERFSVYAERRCCTRQGKIWYMPGANYSYSSW